MVSFPWHLVDGMHSTVDSNALDRFSHCLFQRTTICLFRQNTPCNIVWTNPAWVYWQSCGMLVPTLAGNKIELQHMRIAHNLPLFVVAAWCLLLQIMADGTRKTVSELLASSAPKIAANLQKRRLIPFKSLPTQMGTVAALTYCLKQHPSLLTLSQVKRNGGSPHVLPQTTCLAAHTLTGQEEQWQPSPIASSNILHCSRSHR